MNWKIPLEILAAKFAAVSNHQTPETTRALAAEPRARELLLWLQSQSAKDGGLAALAENFSTLCPDIIGPASLRKLHLKTNYTAKERAAILAEIPHCTRYNAFTNEFITTPEEKWLSRHFWAKAETLQVNDNSPLAPPPHRQPHQAFIDTLDRAAFQRLCADYIQQFLPAECYRVCTVKDAWFVPAWYCEDLVAALLQMMDRSAAVHHAALAKTAVAAAVFDALQFAIEHKAFVRLDGSSRFGKTESIRTFAAMHSGQCRLVTTDCMGTEREFFGAIADSLGLDRDYETTAFQLRLKIDYITAHCHLAIIFDEAHFLLPASVSKSKRPVRLEWIRSHLIDRGNAVILVTTPQTFDPAFLHFRKMTSWNTDQWEGRIRRHIKLPDKISAADLLAIVQKKAPDLSEDWQQMIAAAARLVPGSYLAAVQSIIDSTRWIAQRAQRAKPTLDDLEQAVEEAAPNAAQRQPTPIPVDDPPCQAAPRPIAVRRGRSVTPAPPALALPSVRNITPAPSTQPV